MSTFKPWVVSDDQWGLEFSGGPYDGVVVQITNLEFDQKNEGQVITDYHNVFIPVHLTEEELKTDAYKTALQTAINEMVEEAVLEYEQNRNDNTPQSNN